MNQTFYSRTAKVLFFALLTLSSTLYMLELYGVAYLKWRAGSSLFMTYTSALSSAGYEWEGMLNSAAVVLFFLCCGLLVSLSTALLFHYATMFSSRLMRYFVPTK
ncbi:hypothetical protein NGC23_19995 [Leclercia pneumoniae]|uniref:hypothetical protein n=1 Tax=Leclercia pneumoniae TaxID=2815358 RepID=UPI002DB61944|nr:hypothetical protein [Leclercia pneumoniae]MEB7502449.1 hypothetical protein [Leclercia pneumoniae]